MLQRAYNAAAVGPLSSPTRHTDHAQHYRSITVRRHHIFRHKRVLLVVSPRVLLQRAYNAAAIGPLSSATRHTDHAQYLSVSMKII